MKILIVAGTLSGRGGIETCIKTIASEAVNHGDYVRILSLCACTDDHAWHQDLHIRELPASKSLALQAVTGFPALVAEIGEFKPDAVVAIYSSSLPFVRAACAIARCKAKVAAWLHFSPTLKQRLELLKLSDSVLCISTEIFDVAKKIVDGRRTSIALVHNGTNTDVAPIPSNTRAPLELIHVGRLMIGGQKRTDDVFRALAKVRRDWRLTIVGAGSTEELQELASELGIGNNIKWAGWSSDPWAEAPTADALLLTSAFEGFPMVLVESIARGLPVISSDCSSGPSDIVIPGKTDFSTKLATRMNWQVCWSSSQSRISKWCALRSRARLSASVEKACT